MALFSSGNKHKNRAWELEYEAERIANYEQEQQFKQTLLSNVREARIARSQYLASGLSAEGVTNSGETSAVANIESSLAGVTARANEAKLNTDKYNATIKAAQEEWSKYYKAKSDEAKGWGGVAAAVGTVATIASGGSAAFVLSTAMNAFQGGYSASMGDWGGTMNAVANIASGYFKENLFTDTTNPTGTGSPYVGGSYSSGLNYSTQNRLASLL